jgi:hypothetical protein
MGVVQICRRTQEFSESLAKPPTSKFCAGRLWVLGKSTASSLSAKSLPIYLPSHGVPSSPLR